MKKSIILLLLVFALPSCSIVRLDLFHMIASNLYVISFEPVDSGIPIPVNARINVAFSSPMESWTVEEAFSLEFEGQVFDGDDGQFQWFADNGAFMFIFDPDHDFNTDSFPPSEMITVKIGKLARDRKRFYLTGGLEWNFTTSTNPPDFTSPVVLNWNLFLSEEISSKGYIEIIFSEPMMKSTVEYSFLIYSFDRSDVRGIGQGFLEWYDDNTRIRYYPHEPLMIGIDYEVQLVNNGITCRDLAGNELNMADWFHTFPSEWASSVKIVVDATQVAGDLTDFPVHVDLDQLPTEFFNYVDPSGDDIILITGNRMNKLKRELVYLNTTLNEGELWFKANYLSGKNNTTFHLCYNNPGGSESNDPEVWSNNYIAVYHLHSDISDSTSNNWDGFNIGSINLAAWIGNGQSFNGIDDLIDLPDILKTSSGTVSLWVSPSSWSSENTIFDASRGAPIYMFFFLDTLTGNLRFGLNDIGNDEYIVSTNVSGLSDDTWHHIAGVWKYRDTDNIVLPAAVLYLDGSLVGESEIIKETMPVLRNPYLGFTRDNYKTTGRLTGLIDEVHIASVRRSAEWIKTEYNNQLNPLEGGFFVYIESE